MTTRALTLTGYAVIVALLVAWSIVTAVTTRQPTLAAFVRAVTGSTLGRALLLLGWAWLGWHLFVRASAGFE